MNERSKDIQAVLRHSDARTTEAHYIKASPRFDEAVLRARGQAEGGCDPVGLVINW